MNNTEDEYGNWLYKYFGGDINHVHPETLTAARDAWYASRGEMYKLEDNSDE